MTVESNICTTRPLAQGGERFEESFEHAAAAKFGDRDGNGFQEYETRSPVGYENQGWKDSGDAVVNAEGPKALRRVASHG